MQASALLAEARHTLWTLLQNSRSVMVHGF